MIPFLSHFIEKDPPEKEKGKEAAYFVPEPGPFEKLDLMGTDKCLAVNMAGKTFTIEESLDTKPSCISFVIEKIS